MPILVPTALVGAAVLALAGAAVTAHRAPTGKGVFVRSVKHAPSPAAMVADCKAWGLKWVTIQSIWQLSAGKTKRHHLDLIPSYARALERAGIRVWIWSWPVPGRAHEIAEVYQGLARRAKLRGLILDPEKPYQAKGKEHVGSMEAIASLDVSMLELLDVPLGCTTYGAPPSWHPRFPWSAWSRVTFGMPQLYDTYHRWGAEHQRRTFSAWRNRGFTTLVPIWGASDAHSPAQMTEEINQTPPTFRGAAWWDYYWLRQSKRRAQVVANYTIREAAVA